MVQMKILDMGCNDHKHPDSIGIDINPKSQADVIHDLNEIPYPFERGYFDLIICSHILEHLDDSVAVLKELWRITKHCGVIEIRVPHYSGSGAWGNLEHVKAFSAGIATYIGNYMDGMFKILKIRLNFFSSYEIRDSRIKKYLNGFIGFFADRWIGLCDRTWSKWIGFNEIYIKLEVKK